MREIKFRAWGTEGDGDPMMYDWPHVSECFWEWYMDHQSGDAVLMQYTGLKDKNGVEIYEGDIVSRVGSYNSRRGRFEVKWEDGSDDIYVWHGYAFDGCRVRVIGNIHENPELLAQQGGEDLG